MTTSMVSAMYPLFVSRCVPSKYIKGRWRCQKHVFSASNLDKVYANFFWRFLVLRSQRSQNYSSERICVLEHISKFCTLSNFILILIHSFILFCAVHVWSGWFSSYNHSSVNWMNNTGASILTKQYRFPLICSYLICIIGQCIINYYPNIGGNWTNDFLFSSLKHYRFSQFPVLDLLLTSFTNTPLVLLNWANWTNQIDANNNLL